MNDEPPPPNSPDDYGVVIPFDRESQAQPAKLGTICAAALANTAIPSRAWLVKDMVPDKNVTILSGDGGLGKSLIALQLGVATATATDWIGTLPEPGAVLYVSAEDDIEEVHRRLADIVRAQGMRLDNLKDLHILSLAGRDAVMAVSDAKTGKIAATPLWRALSIEVTTIFPRLVILDNLADVFGGNEISRAEARQFIGMLRGLAIEQKLAVLLIAHPSLSGIASGTGTSGSTAWSNSVRSRLYLTKPNADDEQDDDLRVLTVKKLNYGPAGNEIRLRWENGRFQIEGHMTTPAVAAKEIAVDQIFLSLLARFQAEGRHVSAAPCSTYAPNVFTAHPIGKGFSKKAFEASMNRMLEAGIIKIEKFGPPSKQRSHIVVA